MPNRWTRVPDRAVPPLPRPALPLILLADLFMFVLLSRPRSGSLRTTWVTPGTLVLCAATAAIGAVLMALTRPGPSGHVTLLPLVGYVALIALVGGSCCVATVGLLQRRQ